MKKDQASTKKGWETYVGLRYVGLRWNKGGGFLLSEALTGREEHLGDLPRKVKKTPR